MALARYAVTTATAGVAASATAASAGIAKVEAASRRAFVYEWDFGTAAAAAPVDQNYQIRVKRQSTAGTWTAATPAPLDPADAACSTVGGVASTVAGTAGTVLFTTGVNARAGFRWVAIPDGEYVIPATAAAGIIVEYAAVSGGTDANSATIYFLE